MQNKRKRIASTPSESGRGSSRQARSREATGGSRVEDGTPQLEGQDGDEDAAAPRKRQRKSTTYDSDRPSEYGEELFLEQQQQQQQPVNGSNGHQDSETPAPTGEIGQPGEEETEAALNERYEIWESYAEEYHDIVEQLPLELQRNFQLMVEHDELLQSHEQSIMKAIAEYSALMSEQDGLHRHALVREVQQARQQQQSSGNQELQKVAQPSQIAEQEEMPIDPELLAMMASDTTRAAAASDGDIPTRQGSANSDEEVRTSLLPLSHLIPPSHVSPALPPLPDPALTLSDAARHVRQLLTSLATHLDAAVRTSEAKVSLAETANLWTDRHLKRVDQDLRKHEEALALGLRDGTGPSTDAMEALQTGKAEGGAGKGGGKGLPPRDGTMVVESSTMAFNGEDQIRQSSSKPKKSKKKGRQSSASVQPMIDHSHEYIGDASMSTQGPDETPYCYCQKPSYGEMIGCDNEECPREWFHLGCVGLERPPAGNWYCDDCKAAGYASGKPQKKKSKSRA